MITHSHAIVNPWTVMVESFDAVAANGTVTATARANGVAVGAELGTLNFLKHVHKVDTFILEVSRLHAGCTREEKEAKEGKKAIQCNSPKFEI